MPALSKITLTRLQGRLKTHVYPSNNIKISGLNWALAFRIIELLINNLLSQSQNPTNVQTAFVLYTLDTMLNTEDPVCF